MTHTKHVSAIKTIQSLVVLTCFALGLSALYAWTGPTQSPPLGNIDAPINVGTVLQTKLGSIALLNGFFTAEQGIFAGPVDGSYQSTVAANGVATRKKLNRNRRRPEC